MDKKQKRKNLVGAEMGGGLGRETGKNRKAKTPEVR